MAETNPQPDPNSIPPAANPDPSAAPVQPAKQPEPVKAKKRRRWPWVILVLFLLLLLLVAMVPTIVSSGIGRSIIVSQVNQRINGRLEMKDLSLGWTGGIRADGIVIYDSSNRQILQLPHFETGLTLLNAARGNYAIGKTEIDGLDVLVSREADGSLNWSHIAKSETTSKAPEPAKPETNKAPSKLPSVSGEVVVNNASITYEDRSPQQQPPVFVRALQADVKIPSINETISDSVSAEARIGSPNAVPGTLSVTGTADAIKNNLLALSSANVNQTVNLKGLSLAAVSSILGPNLKLDGQTDGNIGFQLSNGTNGTVHMDMHSNRFAARGATLNGASLTSDGLTISLPNTSISVPQGIDHTENAKLQIGDGKSSAFTITLKNASVTQGEGAAAKKVIDSDTLTILTACEVSQSPQGRDVKLTQFKIGDDQGIVSVAKDPKEDVAVTLPATGNPTARGKIDLNADLKKLNDALQAMQGAQVVATDQKGLELKSGLLKGTIALAQATAEQIQVNGDLSLTQITVGDDQTTPIKNESLTLSLQALSNHDGSVVQVPTLNVAGDLCDVTGKDIRLKLSNGSDPKAPPVGMLDKLQQADLSIVVPSISKLQKFFGAFSSPTPKTAANYATGPAFAYAGKMPPAGAAPTSQPAKPELPPADITSGSATISLKVTNEGHQLDIRPGAKITDLALKRGEFAYNAGNIDFATKILANPAPVTPGAPAPSGLDQIRELIVAELALNAPTLQTSVSLGQPIDVKEPGGLAEVFSPKPGAKPRAAAVNGRLRVAGELQPLIALNQAMSGEKAAHQMAGGFVLDEVFGTDAAGAIATKGQIDLSNLVTDGQANPEKAFRILNDVSLNTAAKLLAMNNVSVQATTTNALNLTLKGKIADLGGKQQIQDQLTADLSYDLAPLWQVLLPLMTPEQRKSYADVTVAGKYQKQFVVTGAYPSGKPFNEAVQSVAVWGSLQFDGFLKKNAGIELKDADFPIDLKDGVARVQYHGKPDGQNLPPPMVCNNGHINLGGTAIDLKTQHTLVTTPKGLTLLKDVSLNPALASWGLGDYLNNPLFVGAKEATGQINATILNCDALAVDDLGAGIGTAKVDMTIGTLQLGSPDIAKVLPQAFLNSFRGEVPAYHVTIAKGMLSQDFTLVLLESKRPINLTGTVNLATRQLVDTTLILPWSLFALKDKSLESLMPEGVKIPMKGQSNSPIPALDFNQLIQQNAGNTLQKLLQGGNKNNNQPGNQPNGQQDPLKALTDLLNKNKNNQQQQPQQQPMPQQQAPANQDPAKALEDLVNGNKNPPPATSQPAQQQQEDPVKALTDLFKKKKK